MLPNSIFLYLCTWHTLNYTLNYFSLFTLSVLYFVRNKPMTGMRGVADLSPMELWKGWWKRLQFEGWDGGGEGGSMV